MPNDSRRTEPRYDRKLEVEVIANGQTLTATSHNISLGGILVATMEAIIPKTAVRVRFKVPTQPEPIDVTAEVRWTEPYKDGLTQLGIRFGSLRAREVWALNRFLAS